MMILSRPTKTNFQVGRSAIEQGRLEALNLPKAIRDYLEYRDRRSFFLPYLEAKAKSFIILINWLFQVRSLGQWMGILPSRSINFAQMEIQKILPMSPQKVSMIWQISWVWWIQNRFCGENCFLNCSSVCHPVCWQWITFPVQYLFVLQQPTNTSHLCSCRSV